MGIIVNLVVGTIAVFVTAYILPGVTVGGWTPAFIAAIILGLINAILKPLFILFTLPLNILTLGLFTFVVNAVMVMLTSQLVDGFSVNGFWQALVFSIVLTLISSFIHSLVK